MVVIIAVRTKGKMPQSLSLGTVSIRYVLTHGYDFVNR